MRSDIDYERLYRDVIPSVVSLYVGRETPGMGSGSGFVYDDRHVVTNAHVVGRSLDVELRFADGSWGTGRVVGTDHYTDLAVVEVAALPALGNPLGLDGSITAGIVSGANRSMSTPGGFAIPDVVQTDAPINPGNSSGPLVAVVDAGTGSNGGDASDDDDGNDAGDDGAGGDGDASGSAYEVVGVNRAKQGDNIGFAVSPEIVNRVVPDLVEGGRFRHSYLRTRTLDVTPSVAEANDLDDPRGVLVVDADAAPAEGDALRGSEGFRTIRGREIPVGGDVIVGVDGEELRSHEELMRYLITRTRPGEPVELTILRDGVETTLPVVLGERPDPERGRRDGRGRGEGSGGEDPGGHDDDPDGHDDDPDGHGDDPDGHSDENGGSPIPIR